MADLQGVIARLYTAPPQKKKKRGKRKRQKGKRKKGKRERKG